MFCTQIHHSLIPAQILVRFVIRLQSDAFVRETLRYKSLHRGLEFGIVNKRFHYRQLSTTSRNSKNQSRTGFEVSACPCDL